MFGFKFDKIVDPYNTMGAAAPAKRGKPSDARDYTTKGIAARYGITRAAAVKVLDLMSEIDDNCGRPAKCEDLRDQAHRIIEDPKNWTRE